MKTLYYLVILPIFVSICFGQTNSSTTTNYDMSPYIHFVVNATNGLKLGILSYESSSITNTTEDPIGLIFNLTNNEGFAHLYIPKNEFLGDIALFDTNNFPVRKTAIGEGFKFLPLQHWNRNVVRQHHITGGMAPEQWTIYNGWGVERLQNGTSQSIYTSWSRPLELPSPSQLFEIKKSGNYRLMLKIQVFLQTGTNKDLVHFPSLEIPVVQPDEINSLSKVQTNALTK